MLCFPNAKINIGLSVIHRRADGFHDLETVFYPIPVKDALEILPAREGQKEPWTIHASGVPVAGLPGDNLIIKACTLLAEDFPGKVKPLTAFLYKNIPMGAGLGGGSADAAFMLMMLNDYYQLGLSKAQLQQYALALGSDCPFFLENKPCFAEGRGEILTPLQLDLSAYSFQLICPDLHVSTAAAYKEIAPKAAGFDLRQTGNLPVAQWKDHIQNDFEQPVFKRYPHLEHIKQQLYGQGAVYAAMSGSGSGMYGIFPKGKKADVRISLSLKEFYCKDIF
jgi:4-diphosphocytidyl-2-C-methyl-D-erythritol kinase